MARTMATITERRAAAELRKRQAGEAGERGGDEAFRLYRSQAPGVGRARTVSMATEIGTFPVERNGKPMTHTYGLFTRYERAYPMWDSFGEYEEVIARGAGRETLAANPDVAFLVNHKGVTMARTRNKTLVLEERDEGGYHEAWLNPERQDVRDFVSAVNDGLITEMSYAFMIPDGKAEWSEDFLTYRIGMYDIDRGDVSGVNYGANPYTDIAAQTPDVLDALDRMPAGALREAGARLAARGETVPASARERIEVRGPARTVDPAASRAVRALQGRVARTAARYVELAERTGMSVAEAMTARLPWYEIRQQRRAGGNTGGVIEDDTAPLVDDAPEATDVFIFDEIGGSFGVDPEDFARELNDISTPQLNIRINSPGGSVFDGEAIHSAILHHPAHTTVFIDGLAASAASLIALAADEVVVMPAGEWMIHDASMMTEGNPADHEKGRIFLERHSDHIAGILAAKMGTSPEHVRGLMRDETWAFPKEAVEMGLADRIGTRADARPDAGGDIEERMQCSHDLSHWGYRYQGRAAAPDPRRTRADVDRRRAALEEVNGAEGEERAAAIRAELDARADQAAQIQRSSVAEPKGRSIALIQAALAVRARE